MKIIVTGGAGFIGSNLVEALLRLGHTVLVLDNLSTGSRDNVKAFRKNKRYDFQFIDLANDEYFVWGKYDAIVHLAALPRIQLSLDKPIETHSSNVTATLQVIKLAKRLKIKKIIYASSSSVYGDQKELPLHEGLQPNPLSPYALHKLISEQYLKMFQKIYDLEVSCLRFFNVYGPKMDIRGDYKLVFGNWIQSIREGKKLKIFGDGKQTRDFTHVKDVVMAIVYILESELKLGFEVLNVGSGTETSVNTLADLFGYEKEYVEPRGFEEKRKVAAIDKINDLYSWTPKITLEEGVKTLFKEYAI